MQGAIEQKPVANMRSLHDSASRPVLMSYGILFAVRYFAYCFFGYSFLQKKQIPQRTQIPAM